MASDGSSVSRSDRTSPDDALFYGLLDHWRWTCRTSCSHEIDPRLQTVVITKDKLEESNSAYAQGGIASVWDPEDRFDNHVQDTLTAGGALCDQEVVEMVVREAPTRVAELIQWGTRFDSNNGALLLGREGGHSHQRIIHALGDSTGKEIMRAMMQHTVTCLMFRSGNQLSQSI